MSSEQPKLEWIPIPKDRKLPVGKLALRFPNGQWTVSMWTPWDPTPVKATDYCPIPEPVMPTPVPQNCPFCGSSTLTREVCGGGWYVICDSAHTDCGYAGPTRSTETAAVAVHNRITLREVDND